MRVHPDGRWGPSEPAPGRDDAAGGNPPDSVQHEASLLGCFSRLRAGYLQTRGQKRFLHAPATWKVKSKHVGIVLYLLSAGHS